MNKTEYVDCISRSLSGRVSPAVQQETISYYKEYIDSQIVKGDPEELVLANLGDPALLAKSVIASQPEVYEGEVVSDMKSDEADAQSRGFMIVVGVLLAVLLIVLLVIALLFHAALKYMPILIPVICILLMIKKLRR
ncbi:MAG: DUF1700 domain-containing protein [Lachnospiraceae bacterium]|nr:DUF1700 domain-containing protein [Lachnospiraceae bacterium]